MLLVQVPGELDEVQPASLARIVRDEEVARIVGSGRQLAAPRAAAHLRRWLEEARACGIAAVERFATALQQQQPAFNQENVIGKLKVR